MNLITGSKGLIGKELIKFLKKNKVEYREIEKAECSSIKEYQNSQDHSDMNANSLIHLAAANNHKNYSYDQFYDVNVNLTLKLFKYAESKSVRKFIFFSSIHCQDNISEEDNYSKTKKLAEIELRKLACNSRMELFILRLPPVIDKNTRGNLKLIYSYLKFNLPLMLPSIAKNNKRSVICVNNINYILHDILVNNVKANTYMVSRKNDLSTYEIMLMIKKDIGSYSIIFTAPSMFFKPMKIFFNSLYSSLLNDQTFKKDQIGEFLQIDD